MVIKKAIIIDLDGTLADCEHRVHHLHKTPKDWKSFYSGLINDELNSWCHDLMKAMKNTGFELLIVTGREETYRQESISWLEKYNIEYDALYMRGKKDYREDSEIKKEIYLDKIKDKYDVSFVLDDRLSVVKMWRELGLTCLQCDWGDF